MQLANVLSYLALLLVNALAGATTLIGGQRTSDVALKFRSYLDPAPYAFSIWGVIYAAVGVAVFSSSPPPGPAWLFPLICALNVSWLFVWGSGRLLAAHPIILAYAALAALLWSRCASSPSTAWYVASSLHFGWLVCACTVGSPIVLKYATGASLGAVSSAVALAVVAVGALYVTRDPIVAGVLAWALLAVYVGQTRRISSALPYSPLVRFASGGLSALSAVVAVYHLKA